MTPLAILSYDGTTHDDDAIALGRMLARGGIELALAYVRHSREYDPRREEIGRFDAERRLEQGARMLDLDGVACHVVIDPSTSHGLAGLAAEAGAELILFGSDYRTPPGRVQPGGSAQGLLEGGAVAVGVAQAGLRTFADPHVRTIAIAGDPDGPADRTARVMAAAFDAELVDSVDADLILVDSQREAPEGRIALGGPTRARLDSARGSVVVLPRGRALDL